MGVITVRVRGGPRQQTGDSHKAFRHEERTRSAVLFFSYRDDWR